MPRVAWTGFGKFNGVEENPSATLAERLATLHRDEGDSWEVVEVSGEAAKAASRNGGDAALVIHLGVATDYDTITLERCAYNDATFRVADERGWQPDGEKISAGAPFGAPSPTSLDVEAAAASASAAGHAVRVSDDAGRFVCNYIYYCSLERHPCVFVHVPPLDKVDLEAQVATLAVLRGALLDAAAAAVPPVTALVGGGGDDVAASASDVAADLVAMGIDAAVAQTAVAAGCTSVETAMEFIFAEPPPMPPPPPEARPEPRLKQVLVVRADLGMSCGKIAAQCAHASLGGYRDALRRSPRDADRWVGAGETVIVVQTPADAGADYLRRARNAAAASGLPAALIADAGRTEVAPGTETVLAVGPGPVDDVDAITGALALLK